MMDDVEFSRIIMKHFSRRKSAKKEQVCARERREGEGKDSARALENQENFFDIVD